VVLMAMPHSDRSARAQAREQSRQARKRMEKYIIGAYRMRDIRMEKVRKQRARYARLSGPRLIQLGERAGLVKDKETNAGQDPALD
jgi:hypothetical protein